MPHIADDIADDHNDSVAKQIQNVNKIVPVGIDVFNGGGSFHININVGINKYCPIEITISCQIMVVSRETFYNLQSMSSFPLPPVLL
jgi:hypothetical protein